MDSKLILAIDQGTTGTKVILVNNDGDIVGHEYSEFSQYYPKPGWVEHDANEIWHSTQSLISRVLQSTGRKHSDICGIGITNQRESVVLWDRRTGEPVSNTIVWQDRRTAAICEELKQGGYESLVRGKTGLVLDPYFSGTKIKWSFENVAGLRSRSASGDIAFGTIDSWLIWKLTAGRAHVTDCSNASRTLLFNIHEMAWDKELLDILQIPDSILPEVRDSSAIVAETDPSAFGGTSVPIAGIAGDQQAALFGQTCLEPGMAKNTYGTGSFVLLNTGSEAVQSNHGMLTTVAWKLKDQSVQYALEGAVFITGAAIQWLRDGLGIIEHAHESEALATSVASNDGVYFVPAMSGLGAPHWDPSARGAILGITRGTKRAHIARAALESICYQSLDVIRAMEADSGIKLKEIRADGGAVGNKFLMQFQSDILGVPVIVPAISETTSLGAAYLAGLSVGLWRDTDELVQKWKPASRYEPQMVESERSRLHEEWLTAISRVKS